MSRYFYVNCKAIQHLIKRWCR